MEIYLASEASGVGCVLGLRRLFIAMFAQKDESVVDCASCMTFLVAAVGYGDGL